MNATKVSKKKFKRYIKNIELRNGRKCGTITTSHRMEFLDGDKLVGEIFSNYDGQNGESDYYIYTGENVVRYETFGKHAIPQRTFNNCTFSEAKEYAKCDCNINDIKYSFDPIDNKVTFKFKNESVTRKLPAPKPEKSSWEYWTQDVDVFRGTVIHDAMFDWGREARLLGQTLLQRNRMIEFTPEEQLIVKEIGTDFYRPTGSAWFCPNKVTPGDKDLFGMVSVGQILKLITDHNWEIAGSFSEDALHAAAEGALNFVSLKKGNINLIACMSIEFFNKFDLATDICKMLGGPTVKEERIAIFRRILYGEVPKS